MKSDEMTRLQNLRIAELEEKIAANDEFMKMN